MKAPDFQYQRPTTLDEATGLLAAAGEDGKVIAGGQSLVPIMNMRLAEPGTLVDLTGVAALRTSRETATGASYGATTTHMMFEYGLAPDVTRGLLPHAAAGIGYPAIRNRGTLGGSLGHSDSSAEWPTVMSALDATAHVRSVRGTRAVPVRELLLGFFTTALEPDELITDVEVRRLAPTVRWGMYKMCRKPGEFAESLGVALGERDADGTWQDVELWLGAATDRPLRLSGTEAAVRGRAAADLAPVRLVEPLAADIGQNLSAIDSTARHALQLHAVTVHRALRAAEGRTAHE
ncbi:FAD binding domain-containing protein [Streptomyces sp. SID10853]|uniref:FAD binding domain-containing protein n=1 Tax=Streptomyces sp. SID10853 TaxID=2706028 RepID=UPI001940461A|nr:FAD binding domain-containing protein [Streptomyces sp. SID10853]